jgi:hypothetical protein
MRNVEDTDFSVKGKNETESGGITKSATFPHSQSTWKCIYNGSGTKRNNLAY